MKKKCYSLLHGEEIHVDAGSKIIPAKELTYALEGVELMEKAIEDGKKYREEVAVEIEEAKRKAELEGFKAGFATWLEKIEAQELKIRALREEYKKILIPALLKMFRKVVGRELEQKEDTIVDIVLANLKAVSSHKKIAIYVSPRQKNIVEKHKNRLKALFEELETLTISERADLAPEDIIIETEKGIVNARFENQLHFIEKALSTLFTQLRSKEEEPTS